MPAKFTPSGIAFREYVKGASGSVKEAVVGGVKVLRSLDKEKTSVLTQMAVEMARQGPLDLDQPTETELAKRLGTDAKETVRLLALSMFLSPTITSHELPETVVAVLLEEKLAEQTDAEHIREFLVSLQAKESELDEVHKHNTLAEAVLPSFLDFRTAIDLRLKFKDKKLVLRVPVAVAHLVTDSEQEVWFQLTHVDVKRMLKALQKVLEEMEQAESLQIGE